MQWRLKMKPYQLHIMKGISEEISEAISKEDYQKAQKHAEFLKAFLEDIEKLEKITTES